MFQLALSSTDLATELGPSQSALGWNPLAHQLFAHRLRNKHPFLKNETQRQRLSPTSPILLWEAKLCIYSYIKPSLTRSAGKSRVIAPIAPSSERAPTLLALESQTAANPTEEWTKNFRESPLACLGLGEDRQQPLSNSTLATEIVDQIHKPPAVAVIAQKRATSTKPAPNSSSD